MSKNTRHIQVVDYAIRLLRRGWCKETFALNGEGKSTSYIEDDACKFCASGATLRARYDFRYTNDEHKEFDFAVSKFTNACGVSIVNKNDDPATSLDDIICYLESFKETLGD